MSENLGTILLVDDDANLLELLSMRLTAAGFSVIAVASAEAALTQLSIQRPHLVITDLRMGGMDGMKLFDRIHEQHATLPVIVLTAHGTIPDAVEAMARGVFGYLTKPFDGKEVLQKVKQALALSVSPSDDNGEEWRAAIISRNPRMQELLAEAKLVAASDASVLIRGESGSGKELLAAAIHKASLRRNKPFIAVNCGAIPEQLLESELFGHVRGAFTGAVENQKGLFQAADGGTLFLDEIGDMPLPLQVKLLRVLQEKVIRQIGSSQTIPVDVRILSATHRDLDAAMASGEFREDLYYRLNVVTLNIPSLGERREDIALLAMHFLGKLAAKYRKPIKGFAPDALENLLSGAWPGNVRQLYNVVEQTCALATTPLIPLSLVQKAVREREEEVITYAEAKQRFERAYLTQLLKLTSGNVADAARMADRGRTDFYRLLQRHDVAPALFKRVD